MPALVPDGDGGMAAELRVPVEPRGFGAVLALKAHLIEQLFGHAQLTWSDLAIGLAKAAHHRKDRLQETFLQTRAGGIQAAPQLAWEYRRPRTHSIIVTS